MIKQLCTYCGLFVWHNPQGGKNKGGYRCTKCGFPPTTNPHKSEYFNVMMRRLAKRLV